MAFWGVQQRFLRCDGFMALKIHGRSPTLLPSVKLRESSKRHAVHEGDWLPKVRACVSPNPSPVSGYKRHVAVKGVRSVTFTDCLATRNRFLGERSLPVLQISLNTISVLVWSWYILTFPFASEVLSVVTVLRIQQCAF